MIGAISLLLGMLALDVMPIDLAGAGLALLGIILMVAEAFVPSFGALGLGGAVAFAIGSLMAFDMPGFRLAWPVVAVATARRRLFSPGAGHADSVAPPASVTSGEATLIGADGRVVDWSGDEGPGADAGRNLARPGRDGRLNPGRRSRSSIGTV